MSITITQSGSPGHYLVEGELTIYHVNEFSQRLLDLVGHGGCVELDLAGVAELDAAGLQLLVAAKQHAGAHGTQLGLRGHSPVVVEVFELCQVERLFGDAVMVPARGTR